VAPWKPSLFCSVGKFGAGFSQDARMRMPIGGIGAGCGVPSFTPARISANLLSADKDIPNCRDTQTVFNMITAN
jgi:hypothetical protein